MAQFGTNKKENEKSNFSLHSCSFVSFVASFLRLCVSAVPDSFLYALVPHRGQNRAGAGNRAPQCLTAQVRSESLRTMLYASRAWLASATRSAGLDRIEYSRCNAPANTMGIAHHACCPQSAMANTIHKNERPVFNESFGMRANRLSRASLLVHFTSEQTATACDRTAYHWQP